MIFPDCHRCGADIPLHDEGTLVFCAHCGAAQVQLSESLLEQAEEQATPEPKPATAPDLRWRIALQSIATAAVITGGCALLSIVLAPLILLMWLWIMVSPVVVLGIFHARQPHARITTSFGARVGLLTGIAVTAVLGIIFTAGMAVQRHFGMMAESDARASAMLDRMRAQALSQAGPQPGLGWLNSLHIPEFRAGLVLTGFAMLALVLITFTTTGGAFAGYSRSRRK